jgi:UDP-N-acetylmuramate--alanine ligase
MTHVHFIGIGGSGLSAIARLLKDSGYTVTGSDRTLSPFATDLQAAGVTVYLGHHPRYIQGANWIVRSSAVSDENPEVVAARQANIPVYKRADFLGKLMEDKTGIAVAGTHGKTTTTAMTAFVLTELGCDPSFIVGGVMNNYGINARAGKGSLFVIEADEYDRMFLGLKPRIEIITNLEHDHPDCYPTFEEMVTAFESFISLLPNDGTLIACLEDQGAASLMNRARRVGRRVIAYSIEAEMTIKAQRWIQARNLKANDRGGFDYEAIINIDKAESVPVSLQVPGRHNVLNSLAVMAAISLLGLSTREAGAALGKFTGTGRRFEVKGKKKGVTVIDDYAHHPTEIKATLAAAKARYPKQRIIVVWQPHTYSRTKTLFKDFTLAFEDANEVIVTEIYAAREPRQDFSSAEVVSAMQHPAARFISSLEETTRYLLKHLHKPDVLFVLSAGDADQVSANVLAGL